MAKEVETPFKAYEFNNEEATLAFIFTDLQEMHIRTELTVCAINKAKLAYDPEQPEKLKFETEYWRGKMEMCEELLATHMNTKSALYREMVEAAARAQENSDDNQI